jgi:signal transduction histidine kinase
MAIEEHKDKVLVIDDELGPRESLRFLLKEEFTVRCESSTDSGLKALQEMHPDIVVMDIKMPGKTGIDGLREIRAVDPNVSVVMLTGFGTLETAQEAIRHGANDYVKKPFDAEEMRNLVRKYVARSKVSRQRADAIETLSSLNRSLRQELDEKEDMASLGQASREFVHDIRNPLSVICGYVQLLMDQFENASDLSMADRTAEMHDYLLRMDRSVRRCQEMAKLWSSLGKHDASHMETCDMGAIANEVCDSYAAVVEKAHACLVRDDIAAGGVVRGDSLQLFRAAQNLVSNAIQALPDKYGSVRVSCLIDGDRVVFRVHDNGCGIPASQVDAAFDPYFTTRQGVGGMGLGLFITRKVAELHNGAVSLDNGPEGGAIATLSLPRLSAEARSG